MSEQQATKAEVQTTKLNKLPVPENEATEFSSELANNPANAKEVTSQQTQNEQE